jgi:hypothetical protein
MIDVKIDLNINDLLEKVVHRISRRKARGWSRWWFDNQRPRAHVVSEALHRALYPTVDAGSTGTVDEETLRTGGGIFGAELGDQADAIFDGMYGPESRWARGPREEHLKPSLLVRIAGHVVVLFHGSLGVPSNLVRQWWYIRDGYRWQKRTFIRTEDD